MKFLVKFASGSQVESEREIANLNELLELCTETGGHSLIVRQAKYSWDTCPVITIYDDYVE